MTTKNIVEILKSLADETRLSLVRQLTFEKCEISGSKIIGGCSEILQLSQPTLSHHFNKLVQSGVLVERKSGTEKFYRINDKLLRSIGINPAKL